MNSIKPPTQRLVLPNGIEIVVDGNNIQCSILSADTGHPTFSTKIGDPAEQLLSVALKILGYDTSDQKNWLYDTSPREVRAALRERPKVVSEMWLYHCDTAADK